MWFKTIEWKFNNSTGVGSDVVNCVGSFKFAGVYSLVDLFVEFQLSKGL